MQSISENALSVSGNKTDRRFIALTMSVLLILLLVGISRHEMWRDEMQAWCLARDSASLFEVQQHLLYEGHPISYYLPLFLFTRVTHDPLIMQLFNVALIAGACYVVLVYSPFNKLQKLLFCFSYFPLFEYGIISRSYALELLIIVAFCSMFGQRRVHPWWLFASLALLAQVNAYGLMIALALTATLLLTYLIERKEFPFPKLAATVGTILVITSAALTVKQIAAPSDGYHGEMAAIKEKQPKRFFKAVRAIPIAYAPIPNLETREFWNTDNISKIQNEPATYALVGLVVFLCLALLSPSIPSMFLYLLGTAGLVFFSYTHLLGGLRQQGHLFLILLCSFWLAESTISSTKTAFAPSRVVQSLVSQRARGIFFTLILALQAVAGIYCYVQDVVRPFSSAKLVARFIKQKGWSDMLIIGSNDHEITSVSGYLDRKIFSPESNSFTSFVVNNTSRHNIEFEELAVATKDIMEKQHTRDALLILNYPLGAIPAGFRVEGLNQFDKSIQGDERFYLYRLTLL